MGIKMPERVERSGYFGEDDVLGVGGEGTGEREEEREWWS